MGNDKRVRKPEWLKISIGANERYTETKRIVESHCLHTICLWIPTNRPTLQNRLP